MPLIIDISSSTCKEYLAIRCKTIPKDKVNIRYRKTQHRKL